MDVNQEQNRRLRRAMCDQLQQCNFNASTEACVPRFRTSGRTVATRRPRTVNLQTLKKTLKTHPGRARAVLNALSDYTESDDTEPMAEKVIKWAILPLLPLAGYVMFQKHVDIVKLVIDVILYLRSVLSTDAFDNLWTKYLKPALTYTMSADDTTKVGQVLNPPIVPKAEPVKVKQSGWAGWPLTFIFNQSAYE